MVTALGNLPARVQSPEELELALHRKCKTRADAGGNLLEEMAAALDARIATARQELADLQAEPQ